MISFEDAGWDDYQYWHVTDKAMLKKLHQLIRDIRRDPFGGLGKPEALKNELSGFWLRRISAEHRLVYRVDDGELVIAQCRGHY